MQNQSAGPLAGCGEKPLDLELRPKRHVCKKVGGISHRNGAHVKHDAPRLICFQNLGLMFKREFEGGHTGGRVPERLDLDDGGRQKNPVHARQPGPAYCDWEAAASAVALRASSRSTVFIMTDGPEGAFLVLIVR